MVAAAMEIAIHIGIPEYISERSNRIFSDTWKFALLVLKEWMRFTYEKLSAQLSSFPEILRLGGTDRIPHRDTFRKFAKRIPEGMVDEAIGEAARQLCGPAVISAVDATGFSESNASRHYVKRLRQSGTEDRVVRDYTKATFVGDVESKAIIACDVSPSNVHDSKRFEPALRLAKETGINIVKILADKGYDSERSHEIAKEIFGPDIDTQIPLRECEKTPRQKTVYNKGKNRRDMKRRFDKPTFRMRAIIETINSMIKRKMGDTVRGKNMKSVELEIKFKCLAHNVRLLIERGLVC